METAKARREVALPTRTSITANSLVDECVNALLGSKPTGASKSFGPAVAMT